MLINEQSTRYCYINFLSLWFSAICGYLVSCTLSYGGENRCYVIVSVFHNPDDSLQQHRAYHASLSCYWIVTSKVNTSSCDPSFSRQPQPSEVSSKVWVTLVFILIRRHHLQAQDAVLLPQPPPADLLHGLPRPHALVQRSLRLGEGRGTVRSLSVRPVR